MHAPLHRVWMNIGFPFCSCCELECLDSFSLCRSTNKQIIAGVSTAGGVALFRFPCISSKASSVAAVPAADTGSEGNNDGECRHCGGVGGLTFDATSQWLLSGGVSDMAVVQYRVANGDAEHSASLEDSIQEQQGQGGGGVAVAPTLYSTFVAWSTERLGRFLAA